MQTDIRSRNLRGRPWGVKRAIRQAMPRGSRVPRSLSVLVISGCCALSLACGSGNGKGKDPAAGEAGDRVVLFVTTELKGQIGPSGCNSDAVGGLGRTAARLWERA